MENPFTKAFFINFGKELEKFHSIFIFNKPKGELLEELISNALNKSNIKHEWKCYSHRSNYDILTKNGCKISVKTGSLNKKGNILTISSFRTGKYKTLTEKIDFIEKNTSHYTILCIYHNNKYKIYILDAKILSIKNKQWEGTKNGWQTKSDLYNHTINVRSTMVSNRY